MARVIVLDANVLIAFLDAGDAHHEATIALLETLDGLAIGAPALTLAEALVRPRRTQTHLRSFAALKRIGVQTLHGDDDDILLIAETRETQRLRMPDAVVLATALRRGAAIATFDAPLAAAARDLGLEVLLG